MSDTELIEDKTKLPTEDDVGRKFFSIQWKVILTTTLFLFTVFSLNIGFNIYKTQDKFIQEKEELVNHSRKSFNEILDSEYQIIKSYTNFLALDNNFSEAIDNKNIEELKKTVQKYWWQLEVDYDVASVGIYQDDLEVVKVGETLIPHHFVKKIKEEERPSWVVSCDVNCMLLVGVPYLSNYNTSEMHVVVMSKNLSNSLLTFKNKMNSDVGILRKGKSAAPLSYIKNWDVSLDYLIYKENEKEKKLDILKDLSKDKSFLQIKDSKDISFKVDDKYKNLALYELPNLILGDARLIVFDDITNQKMKELSIIVNNIILGLISLIVIELILIGIMWLPLRSLKDLALALPMIAKAEYKEAREKMKNSLKSSEKGLKLYYDESDALMLNAISLCNQLEQYGNELKARADELGFLAYNDTLTTLYNRRKFQEELERHIKIAKRSGSSGAVLFFDLDNFKDVNDGSGHHVGDEMLKKVALRVKEMCRSNDVVARMGGDEFAIILSNIEEDDAYKVANKICEAISKIELTGKNMLHKASASIGVAMFPDCGEDLETVIYYADIAMYKAKELGRNTVYMFKENDKDMAKINQRVYWAEKAKENPSSEFLKIVCQPIYKFGDERISHYEALLRIKNAEGDFISPVAYILAAEKSGSVYKLDKWVINEVCKNISIMQKFGIDKRISINLSALSFSNDSLVDFVENIFVAHDIDPRRVIFEITETATLTNIYDTIRTMNEIKKLGCKFALDDFGVGFSSFYNLKKLPVDFVKIDGSFIKNIKNDHGDQVLVKALVQVAKEYGELTVAEFVEDEETLNILRDLGVDYAQGYFIDKPIDMDVVFEREKSMLKEIEEK